MPTVQTMQLPMPLNWQEFESITRDALVNQWRSPSLQKNGRVGQKQKGVDIYGPDYLGRLVGVQCKKYKGKLEMKTVLDEIINAEKFEGRLSTLYIATTTEHDSFLQEKIRVLSEKRAHQGKFVVGVLFWDEIVAGLMLNPASVSAHYPQIVVQVPSMVDHDRLLAALEFGYHGADIWECVTLIYGEYGWMVQADPDELIARLRILEHRAQQILLPSDASPIIDALNLVVEGCTSQKKGESDWDHIELQAKRVSKRISMAPSLLKVAEANLLDIGMQLGRIYHHVDDTPSEKVCGIVKTKVQAALGFTNHVDINAVFSEAASLNSGYGWATRIYNFLEREIRYR